MRFFLWDLANVCRALDLWWTVEHDVYGCYTAKGLLCFHYYCCCQTISYLKDPLTVLLPPSPRSCFPAFPSTVVVLAWEAVVSQQYQEDKQRISLLSCIGCCCFGDILFITHLWCLFLFSGCSALRWLIPNVSWFPPAPVALISSGFGTCCFPFPVALSATMSPPNAVGQCQRDLIHQRHLLRICEEESLCLVDLESLQPPEGLAWLPSCEGKEDGEWGEVHAISKKN